MGACYVERQLKLIKQGKKLKEEVRKAEPDLTTSFLRPMPGSARMYPETDVPPIKIEKKYVEKLKKELEFPKKYRNLVKISINFKLST